MYTDYRRFVDNEFKDFNVYKTLAGLERKGPRKEALEKLAEVEKRHYSFWLQHIPEYKPSISSAYLKLVVLTRVLLGVTFVVKVLERHEKHTLEKYRSLAASFHIDNLERHVIEKVIDEEVEVERGLLAQIDEAVVRYLGFMMLGVADAIIELTGVLVGFLGVTSSTLVAGIAGLVVGVAAAISMGAASYLQARQGVSEKPAVSGFVTGSIYMLTVIVLTFPYYMLREMALAVAASLFMAFLLTAFFTYFSSIIQDKSFKRELGLSITLLIVVTIGTYLVGRVLGEYFGIGAVLLV